MKKNMKTLTYIVMAISLAVCAFIGSNRIETEQSYKQFEIAIRYSDVLRIARDTNTPLEEVLTSLKSSGATTLFVRENTVVSAIEPDLYSYKGQGEVSIIDGYILKLYYPQMEDMEPECQYIVTQNPVVAKNILDSYATKDMPLEMTENEGTYFICVGEYSSELTLAGVGFNVEDLNLAASLGYTISPQLKTWTNVTSQSLEYLIGELEKINGLGPIYFADVKIPGSSSELMKNFFQEHQLGFIEFTSNKQEGFNSLAKGASTLGTHYKVVRLHTIGDNQILTFNVTDLVDRYELALRERNNRVFLFKMPTTVNIEEDITYLQEAITNFTQEAIHKGYTLAGEVPDYNLKTIPAFMAILAGLGAIMAFILLLEEIGMTKLGYIIGIVGTIGYIGLLKLNTSLASSLMALFGSIVFPSYAVLKEMKEEPRDIKATLFSLLKICLISFGGVLTTIGCISRTNFALGINVFMGVKFATVLPILLVVFALIYQKHKLDIKYYMSFLDRKISYGALLLFIVLSGVLVVYIMRTGNTGTATDLERQFRQFLDNVLGVRPRTKEFLIAYPILMALLHFGYKESRIVFAILATIGPVSFVNTYAHIHTPILISLLRSAYGIVIGIIIGLVLIWILKYVSKVIQKWQIQNK